MDPALTAEPQSNLDGPRADWGPDAAYRPSPSEFAAHSLEHLAAAASDQYPYNAQTSGSGHGMMSNAPQYAPYHSPEMPHLPAPSVRGMLASTSPTVSYSSNNNNNNNNNNNINSILNHSSSLSPVIDPSLQSAIQRQPTVPDSQAAEKSKQSEKRGAKVHDDHEMVALLRGIAEDHPTQRQEGSLGPNG